MQTMQQQLHAANAATLAAQQTAATAATNEAQATVKTAQEKVQPVTAKETKPEIEREILRQWKADEDYCRSYRKTQSKAVDEDSDDSEKAEAHQDGEDLFHGDIRGEPGILCPARAEREGCCEDAAGQG